MKCNMPKSWYNLPKAERDSLQAAMAERVYDMIDADYAEFQSLWLKVCCILLHRYFGFGKKRLMVFIGDWKTMYRWTSRMKDRAEQIAEVNKEIKDIFGDDFPEEFVERM